MLLYLVDQSTPHCITELLSSEPPPSPCGSCMIPTLIPEIISPRAFSLIGYRGSHDNRGTLLSRHSFNRGPEHLRLYVRVRKRVKKRQKKLLWFDISCAVCVKSVLLLEAVLQTTRFWQTFWHQNYQTKIKWFYILSICQLYICFF